MSRWLVSKFKWVDNKQVAVGEPFEAERAFMSWAQENVWLVDGDWKWKHELMALKEIE